MRMANRTIYLSEELDEVSRRLGLNLSRLTQAAIAEHARHNSDDAIDARVESASARIRDLGIKWPAESLVQQRRDEAER